MSLIYRLIHLLMCFLNRKLSMSKWLPKFMSNFLSAFFLKVVENWRIILYFNKFIIRNYVLDKMIFQLGMKLWAQSSYLFLAVPEYYFMPFPFPVFFLYVNVCAPWMHSKFCNCIWHFKILLNYVYFSVCVTLLSVLFGSL